MLDLTAAAHREGLLILVGTDSSSGLAMARELELMVRAGIPAARALQSATLVAAVALGEDTQRGSIERGRKAELILVDGDPTRRIEDIRRIALVIQGTTAYRPSEIWQQMGFRPFAAPAAIDGPGSED
jgi:imidazolonepropionase-like amidohydrolase